MHITLCCAGGLSTTMLMDTMKAVIKKSQKLHIDDFSFKAIPVDLLDSEISNTDVVVLGPQISHKAEELRKKLEPKNIPVIVVDKDVYGQMDGATVLKQCLIARRKADLAAGKEIK